MKTAKRILYALLTLPLLFLCLADCDSPVDPDPPYDGPWEKVEVPEGIGYFALDFLSPTNGWSAGLNSIGHYDGQSWKIVKTLGDSENKYFLTGIQARTANDIWASGTIERGALPYTYTGVIFHYDGNSWSIEELDIITGVYNIHIFADGTGWGGGVNGLIYFDGSNWTLEETEDYRHLFFNSKTDGWACGLSSIYYWDGTEWTESLSDGNVWFRDIYFNAPNDGWAVSGASLYGFATHYHWDGTEWTKIDGTPFDQKSLDAIHFVDSDWGWIIGSGRTYFYNGVIWKQYETGSTNSAGNAAELRDIYCNSKSDVWISTDVNHFLHFTTF